MVSFSAPARVFFPSEKPTLLYLGFLRFLVFPSVQGLPLPSLFFGGGGAPPPPFYPTTAPPIPHRRRVPVAAGDRRARPLHGRPPSPSATSRRVWLARWRRPAPPWPRP